MYMVGSETGGCHHPTQRIDITGKRHHEEDGGRFSSDKVYMTFMLLHAIN